MPNFKFNKSIFLTKYPLLELSLFQSLNFILMKYLTRFCRIELYKCA